MGRGTTDHRARIARAILVAVGGAAFACGAGTTTTDGNGSSTSSSTGSSCGSSLENVVQEAEGPLCATDDASIADASDDGATGDDGGGDASVSDAGACFATCQEACARAFPEFTTGFGGGSCLVKLVDGRERISCSYTIGHPCGRACAGLRAPSMSASTALGELYARLAWMEAASIVSFRRLARELTEHGAPAALIAAARSAARDEVRHARAMAGLARRHGGTIPRVSHDSFVLRSLEEIARENAVEGCIGETYSAAVTSWQAEHAGDPEDRRVLEAIAEDEIDHSALAFAIADWILPKLDVAGRERIRDATSRAIVAMQALAERVVDPALVREAGLPPPVAARRLADEVARLAA